MKIIRRITLIAILLTVSYLIYGYHKESQIRILEESQDAIQVKKIISTAPQSTKKEEVNIPKTYLGFEVTAKLNIPKIDLEVNVLKNYSQKALDTSATKFWGPDPNEIGNFCIAGHNYEKDNIFNNLIDLEIGDELFLLDNKNDKCAYEIYDIYKVKPSNTNPLNQDTDGKRIITLITSVNYSNNRLIVQAVEKGEN